MIGTVDEKHVFPEGIIMDDNELLVALQFIVAAPTAVDGNDLLLRRREVMTGRHSTHLYLFAAEMTKHFCETLLFKLNLCEMRCPAICD